MGIENLALADDLQVVVVRDLLGVDELRGLRERLERAASPAHPLRVLIVLRDFAGWERSPGWSDVADVDMPDRHLRRIAIVGEPRWRAETLLFMANELRAVPIEYFAPAALDDAIRWLITT